MLQPFSIVHILNTIAPATRLESTMAYVTPLSPDVAAEMDAVLNRKRPRTEDDVASLENRLRLAEEARARAESELDEMKIDAAATTVRRRLKEQRACTWLAKLQGLEEDLDARDRSVSHRERSVSLLESTYYNKDEELREKEALLRERELELVDREIALADRD